jgi:hypothetical protein
MITKIPGIEYAAPPRAAAATGSLSWPPRLVVVHDTGNSSSTRYDEAHYAATRTDAQANWTSAHAYVDRGGVLGSLVLNLRAWSAFSYANANGFHIEICKKDLYNADALRWAAWTVRQLCQAAGIPMTKLSPAQVAAGQRGVCGHLDLTLAHIDGNDHTDPGYDFAWPAFMGMVNDSGQFTTESESDMGQSFGPVQLEAGVTSLVIPPVNAGAADPRRTWLNLGGDLGNDKAALRVWLSDGTGWTGPLAGTGFDSNGVVQLANAKVVSVELPTGTRLVSVTRVPATGETDPFTRSLSACFERM